MAVGLIAINFLRENRWPILVLLVWIVLTALAAGGFGRDRTAPDDVIFYIQQQAIYICLFSTFLAAGAIHNERKSRRILLVLAKAVKRSEYLLAIVTGSLALATAASVLFGVCCLWLTHRAGLPGDRVWPLVIVLLAISAIASTLAIFFSTFLNPYLAITLTLVVFSAPWLVHFGRAPISPWIPGLPLLLNLLRFSFGARWAVDWSAVVAALVESAAFFMLASAVFARRDIAVPVE
jgi:ABC-type transport system involved in multi-copper enzyme maturation permease subunit